MDLYDMLIPFFLIGVTGFVVQQSTQSKAGFMGGAVMAIIVLYGSGLVGGWAIMLSVLALVGLFFGNDIRERAVRE